jgi:hypothetical protein
MGLIRVHCVSKKKKTNNKGFGVGRETFKKLQKTR